MRSLRGIDVAAAVAVLGLLVPVKGEESASVQAQEAWQAALRDVVPRLSSQGESALESFAFEVVLPFLELSIECRREPGNVVKTLTRDTVTRQVVSYSADGLTLYPRPDWPGRFRVIRPVREGNCDFQVKGDSIGIHFGASQADTGGIALDLTGWKNQVMNASPGGLFRRRQGPDGNLIFTHYLRSKAKRMVLSPEANAYPIREIALHSPDEVDALVRRIEPIETDDSPWRTVSTAMLRENGLWYDVFHVTEDSSNDEYLKEWRQVLVQMEQRRSAAAMASARRLEQLITGETQPRRPLEELGTDYEPWPEPALKAALEEPMPYNPSLRLPKGTHEIQGRRRSNVLEIPIRIDDRQSVWIDVDTGMERPLLLNRALADSWKITGFRTETKTTDSGSRVTTQRGGIVGESRDISGSYELVQCAVDSVRLGESALVMEDTQPVYAASMTHENDGVAGRKLLEMAPFTLDYQAATVVFHDPDNFTPPENGQRWPFEIRGGYWVTQGLIFPSQDESATPIPLRLVIDTGYSGSLSITNRFLEAHPTLLEGRPVSEMLAHTVVATASLDLFNLPRAIVFGEQRENVPGHQFDTDLSPQIDGLLGGEWLRRYRVTFDRKNMCLYLEKITIDDLTKHLPDGDLDRDLPHTDTTPLAEAATNGDARMVQALLERGASPKIRDALSEAIFGQHQACIDLLLAAGADPKESEGTPLRLAAWRGSSALIEQLLKAGAGPPEKSSDETYSALHRAVLRGDLDIVRMLVEAGADLTDRFQNNTILNLAAAKGHTAITEYLLERGADPNEPSSKDWTPAHSAAALGNTGLLKKLAGAGADLSAIKADGLTPAGHAAGQGHLDTLRWLVDQVGSLSEAAGPRTPLLCAAASEGHLEIVQWLLDAGADPNAVDATPSARPALLGALRGPHVEIADLLLDAGADPNIAEIMPGTEKAGQFALYYAGSHGLSEMVQKLFEKGAQVDQLQARQLISATAKAAHWETVLLILQRLENLDDGAIDALLANIIRNRSSERFLAKLAPYLALETLNPVRRKLLFAAIDRGHHGYLKMYLDAGLDPNLVRFNEERGPIPMLWDAAAEGSEVTVALLLEAGAKIDAGGGRDEDSPLSRAAIHGDPAIVQLFINHGAQVDHEDLDGVTPLMKAAEKGHTDVVETLLRAGADPERKDFLGNKIEDHIEDNERREEWREIFQAWQNGDFDKSLEKKAWNLEVEIEEDLYTYTSANNGAGPMWCAGSTSLVRTQGRVFATSLETLTDEEPLNNCRWKLHQRAEDGWKVIHENDGRTREPAPLAGFANGDVFVSGNPTLGSGAQPNGGPARPDLWQFSSSTGEAKQHFPQWQDSPPFREHSYRSLATDGARGELFLMQNIGYGHAEWAFRDAGGAWSAQGKLEWPWGADYEKPKPVRLCYPNVALRDRAVHFFGVEDVTESVAAWRKHKTELTGNAWDYVFRRLYYTHNPDITSQPFAAWLEIANLEATAGHAWPCDLYLAPNADVHLLWSESAVDERLRPAFFPQAKQARRLKHAVVRQGKVASTATLLESTEDRPGLHASRARFHVLPGNELFVVAHVTGTEPQSGLAVNENRLLELDAEGEIARSTTIPLNKPFTNFFTATPRAGSPPSDRLDLLGTQQGKSGTISYARVRIR